MNRYDFAFGDDEARLAIRLLEQEGSEMALSMAADLREAFDVPAHALLGVCETVRLS